MIPLPVLAAFFDFRDETAPGCCGKPFVIRGEIRHVKNDSPDVRGTPYAEEVYGSDFTATVSDLEAGTYNVKIQLVEHYFGSPGNRIMSIDCDDARVNQLDVFQVAGGKDKPTVVALKVHHPSGALNIRFRAVKNNAKFNGILVSTADGKPVASVMASELVDLEQAAAQVAPTVVGPEIFRDASRTPSERAADIVRRMSLAEKVGQMVNGARAIPRLGVPAYDWWNEALHGVARNGRATVFPQAIGLAATWDPELVREVFKTASIEARAKYREAFDRGQINRYQGLTFWTPNINLYRDPRWGRGQETYGEDPFLTSQMGIAVVQGLQGDVNHPRTIATLKHFAVHSGPEGERHRFDATPSEDDLYDSYLPHFERVVRLAKPWSIMGAYNRVLGEPACSSKLLLQDLLRDRWGFKGYVVSDCGAITDIWANHKVVATRAEAAARAVIAGCDLECGGDYSSLVRAVNAKLITTEQIDRALLRLFESRYRVGLLDSPTTGPYASIKASDYDTAANDALALRAAERSIVLLKNRGALPLAASKKVALVGPNADSVAVLLGNYNGSPSHPVALRAGLETRLGARLTVSAGGPLATPKQSMAGADAIQAAVEAANGADVIVYAGGLSPRLEGEEGDAVRALDGFDNGDRTRIELPTVQVEYVKALRRLGKPIVFVNFSGGSVALTAVENDVDAILQVWYPGQRGGTAITNVLLGDVNPSGRLPVTFYRSTADLPDFRDYAMKNRTYRFYQGPVEWPFGFGLSYRTSRLERYSARRDSRYVRVHVDAVNPTGSLTRVVVPVYARPSHPRPNKPKVQLVAFASVELKPNERRGVDQVVPIDSLATWNAKLGSRVVTPDDYEFFVGGHEELRQKLALR